MNRARSGYGHNQLHAHKMALLHFAFSLLGITGVVVAAVVAGPHRLNTPGTIAAQIVAGAFAWYSMIEMDCWLKKMLRSGGR